MEVRQQLTVLSSLYLGGSPCSDLKSSVSGASTFLCLLDGPKVCYTPFFLQSLATSFCLSLFPIHTRYLNQNIKMDLSVSTRCYWRNVLTRFHVACLNQNESMLRTLYEITFVLCTWGIQEK